MNVDDFLALVASEEQFSEERVVKVRGPALEAELARRGGMPLLEFMAHSDLHPERRTLRWGHLVGPGVDSTRIAAWRVGNPGRHLPDDLRALLGRVDGIHLWADLDEGRAYSGIAPLTDWIEAGAAQWNGFFAEEHARSLVISYHANSDDFVLLEPDVSVYRLVDPQDFGELGDVVARSVNELLDWLWTRHFELDPRRTE